VGRRLQRDPQREPRVAQCGIQRRQLHVPDRPLRSDDERTPPARTAIEQHDLARAEPLPPRGKAAALERLAHDRRRAPPARFEAMLEPTDPPAERAVPCILSGVALPGQELVAQPHDRRPCLFRETVRARVQEILDEVG